MKTLLLHAIVIGIGATLCIDAWSGLLRRAFGIRSLDYCMLGRWLLHMPAGRILHRSITDALPRRHECASGWAAHYSIGIGLVALFLLLIPDAWLTRPTPGQAILYGVVTVVVPFLTIQPAIGLGVASSRTPRPMLARVKSLGTHTIFGLGIYLSALLMSLAH